MNGIVIEIEAFDKEGKCISVEAFWKGILEEDD